MWAIERPDTNTQLLWEGGEFIPVDHSRYRSQSGTTRARFLIHHERVIPTDLNCPECDTRVYSYTPEALVKEVEKYCHNCGARFDINEAHGE